MTEEKNLKDRPDSGKRAAPGRQRFRPGMEPGKPFSEFAMERARRNREAAE